MKLMQLINRINFFISDKISMMKYLWRKYRISNTDNNRDKTVQNKIIIFPVIQDNELISKDEDLVSVIMTTFNTEKYVLKSINSILDQTYKNIELIVVDDASTDSTRDIISGINDPRLTLYQNKINCGTYYSKNFGITKANGKFITMMDSDDTSDPTRIEKQVLYLKTNPKCQLVRCQYVRINDKGEETILPRVAIISSMFRRELTQRIGYYDTVRVTADDEFDVRAKTVLGPVGMGVLKEVLYYGIERNDSLTDRIKIGSDSRLNYVNNYKIWHQAVRDSNSALYMPFPLESRLFPAPPEITVDLNVQHLPNLNTSRITRKADRVTATLATIPERKSTLLMTINSILHQVDELRVYLNNFEQVPAWLNHPKIKYQLSGEHGEIADNGKFFWDDIEGFHFTIDDDILYPGNYVSVLIDLIKKYNYTALAGVHGITINHRQFKSYYELNSRIVYGFSKELTEEKFVNIIGTGTLAYHTKTFHFDLSQVNEKRMIDIFVGQKAQEKNIPMVITRRGKNWLVDLNMNNQTIYHRFVNDDSIQTKLIRSSKWLDFTSK